MPNKKRKLKTASLRHEKNYYAHGCKYIFGMDEVGRGPWAGPVTVGAVCLPVMRKDLLQKLEGVRDSKDMTPLQRSTLDQKIKDVALAWGIGSVSAKEIDEIGINPATKVAMQRALDQALQGAEIEPDCLFLDYVLWPERRDIPQVSIIGGDRHSLSIAAASVLAKVSRDEYMIEMDAKYPQYGFALHKGYGTAKHQAALEEYGPSPIHRMYYKPLQALSNPDKS